MYRSTSKVAHLDLVVRCRSHKFPSRSASIALAPDLPYPPATPYSRQHQHRRLSDKGHPSAPSPSPRAHKICGSSRCEPLLWVECVCELCALVCESQSCVTLRMCAEFRSEGGVGHVPGSFLFGMLQHECGKDSRRLGCGFPTGFGDGSRCNR